MHSPTDTAAGARPRLAWSDLPSRRVGIYGMGVEGRASLAACHERGVDPVLVDDRPAAGDGGGSAVLATSRGGLEALATCDVVIKSPGISRYGEVVRGLVGRGVPVVGGVGLWLADADLTRVLLVTGTKGKSTTTAIAGHLLRSWGSRCFVGGNIGNPPYDPAAGDDFDHFVLEVSSFQATDLAVSPPVTVVTALGEDHLPWHDGDVEIYRADKLSATSQPGARLTIANGDSDTLREHAGLLGPEVRWVSAADTEGAAWIDRLGLVGAHNRRNAALAREALRAMGVTQAADDDAMVAAAAGFSGLPYRLQVAGHRGEVTFVNDSLATNVLPVIAAVEAFADRRVALLVGGQSRGVDYTELGVGLRSHRSELALVTMPTNGPDIAAQVMRSDPGQQVCVIHGDSLSNAVRLAADWAELDGVVLFSPAAPSFDHFRDYRARGDAFVAAMEACGGTAS